ncbi:hypothetical protein QBC34DRAFT_360606 [Podospora aff. communis PSN243]|uniref:Uncharacterized protein n=1 Tax=Podospora aff. communis PSN243 TaxID=3040156 RepID=A0AAV9G5Z8_9PEZI|nr:hypothetical protein QBC34DRAFT_360606 [Podospora aff. communis PSN243]
MLVCSGATIRLDLLVDLVQVLCWLGIVLSGAPEVDSLRLARSKLEFADMDDDGVLDIDFAVYSFPMDEDSAGVCWAPLLHGFHIAQNFPVPSRSHGIGLEMSLPMLTRICGADRAVSYDGGQVIKGFSTMLVPQKVLDDVVQWHLVCSKDPSSRLSYPEGVSRCGGRLMEHELSFDDILRRRAVVGWWSESEIILDAAAGNGSSVKYSSADPAKSYVKISEVSLGFQQIFAGEIKISLASRYSKFHFPRSGQYLDMLRNASRTPVVLFDVGARRGWMLPATLVLLLTAHHRIGEGPWEGWAEPSCFEDGLPTSADRVLTFLAQSARTKLSAGYCFSDLILSIWASLEYLLDARLHHERESPGDMKLPNRMVGFEYRAIVQDRSPLLLKQVKVKRTAGGWTDLVRDKDALVLFGNGFGELVRPVNADTICPGWGNLPTGKDYLAVLPSLLLDFYETSGSSAVDPALTFSKLRWEKGDALLFGQCSEQQGLRCICHRAQQIKRGRIKNPGSASDLTTSPSAVVVMGSPASNFRRNGSAIPYSVLEVCIKTVILRNRMRLRQFFRVGAEGDGTSTTLVAMSDLGDQATLGS